MKKNTVLKAPRRTLVRFLFLLTIILSILTLSACSFGVGSASGNGSLVDSLGSAGESGRALREANELHLKLFDGGEVTLSELRGKAVVVNFWASWCPPCQDEAPALEKVWKAYKDKGVVFIGVDVQDTESNARAFIKKYGVTYPNGTDDSRRILEDWVVTNIPTTFFITPEGKVARKWVGPLNENQLVALVESLVK